MIYTKILPKEGLKPYVQYFGLLEESSRLQTKRFKIIVEGHPGLIFQQYPNCFRDKNNHEFPQLFLHGLITSHSEKTATGNYLNIAVSFRPNALRTIFGLNANELTDRYIGLNEIIRSDLTDQLLHETSNSKKIELITDFILDQAEKNNRKKNYPIDFLIEGIKTQGYYNLKDIQHDFNLSERALERIFKYEVGISPKLFIRINRFQTALNSIRRQKFESLSQTAYNHFYTDQSHYIKDFKEFAGTTPKQFLLHAHEKAENFPEWDS